MANITYNLNINIAIMGILKTNISTITIPEMLTKTNCQI